MSFYDVEGPVVRPAEQDMGFGNGYGIGAGYGLPNHSTETMFPTPRPSGNLADPLRSGSGMKREPTTASMYAQESRQQQQQGVDYANFPVPSPVPVTGPVPVVGVAK